MAVSKPILDEAGLIACMAYIDLNPVRANMTDSIENSKYTSIFKRIKQKRNYGLCPMSDELSEKSKDIGKSFVPCNKDDYIELVRETGKIIREDKKGYIKESAILDKLKINKSLWAVLVKSFNSLFKSYAGRVSSLNSLISNNISKRRVDVKNAACFF